MIEPPGPHDPDGVVMKAMLASCPSFAAPWGEYVTSGDRAGAYVDTGVFAEHLVDSLDRGATTEFPAVFGAVERLLADGDVGVRYLIVHGLIESIQNAAANRHDWTFASKFRQWLGPATTTEWDEVHREWGTSDDDPPHPM